MRHVRDLKDELDIHRFNYHPSIKLNLSDCTKVDISGVNNMCNLAWINYYTLYTRISVTIRLKHQVDTRLIDMSRIDEIARLAIDKYIDDKSIINSNLYEIELYLKCVVADCGTITGCWFEDADFSYNDG